MKYFIFQSNDHDCGFASLKMLLATLARDKSYLYISKPLKRSDYTLTDLKDIADSFGVELGAYCCDEDYYEKLKCPCLTLIDNNHVVLVKKISKKRIKFYDPNEGSVTIKKEQFLARWRYKILEVEDASNLKKIEKKRQPILNSKLRIFETIFGVISSVILIITFYLLNGVKSSIFSLVFLALFASFQIIENMIVHREIYHFDNTYIKPYFYQKKNQNKLSYLEFINFKQKYFTKNRSLLSAVLTAFLITFLLCFNDFRNAFVLIALILIKLLDSLCFSKAEEKNQKRIAEYEGRCFKTTDNFVDNCLKANNLANLNVCQRSIKSIFYMVAAFGFALIMLIVTKNSGCNFVIFHFVLYYAGFNSYANVIDSLSNRKELMKSERRFIDSCNL